MTEINLEKIHQRKISIRKRISLKKKYDSSSQVLSVHLKNLTNFHSYKIIASFISIKSEISTQILNKFLLDNNKILCLPVIKKNFKILSFIEYSAKTKLIPGKFGILEPNDLDKELLPEIILTPCLAFDEKGFRLGYGGGYYDKTFTYLKKNKHKFISIAVAFDDQRVSEIIREDHDQKINYILTEKKLYKTS